PGWSDHLGGAYRLRNRSSQAKPGAKALAAEMRGARRILGAGMQESSSDVENAQKRLQVEYDLASLAIEEQLGNADSVEVNFRERAKEKLKVQPPRLLDKISATREQKLWDLQQEREATLSALQV